ncbi:hypothetical protein [Treponema pedis]|uniref:hypothetical protein n=1 Tax=Treponema pedis TaxID=409322 RepID=UPI0003FC655A|nr:hypothetical protein [Treponema pedis]
MGLAKKDLEKQEINEKSGIFCSRCGEEIPKSELQAEHQSKRTHLCSRCKVEFERLDKK